MISLKNNTTSAFPFVSIHHLEKFGNRSWKKISGEIETIPSFLKCHSSTCVHCLFLLFCCYITILFYLINYILPCHHIKQAYRTSKRRSPIPLLPQSQHCSMKCVSLYILRIHVDDILNHH